jgi:hypothetical protein
MVNSPFLDFYCHGQVKPDELAWIRNILEETYSRLGSRRQLPERVEVNLFETSGKLLEFLQEQKKELGIDTSGDEAFICSHDAWRGYSRLSVCLERLNTLSTKARLGALRHEVAHSVLHGKPEYYVLRISADCLELACARGITHALLQQVLYYCAIAVKDFEVTRLLLDAGYSECQLAFVKTMFLPSDDDKLAWSLLESNPKGKFIFFCNQLKTLLLGMPLETAGLAQLENRYDNMLSYVSAKERSNWLDFTRSLAKHLGDDTHANIQQVLRAVLQFDRVT